MKKSVSIILAILFLSLVFTGTASASGAAPVGSCAPGFELHSYMDQCKVDMPNHIGIIQDLNGDGFVCMKQLSNDLHVHVDNFLPLH